jgi:hypothetical protein
MPSVALASMRSARSAREIRAPVSGVIGPRVVQAGMRTIREDDGPADERPREAAFFDEARLLAMIASDCGHGCAQKGARDAVQEPRPILRVADRRRRQHDEPVDAVRLHRVDHVGDPAREDVVRRSLACPSALTTAPFRSTTRLTASMLVTSPPTKAARPSVSAGFGGSRTSAVTAWPASRACVTSSAADAVLLAAMVPLLFASLAVPHAFGKDALPFGVAYFFVRALHIAAYSALARDNPVLRAAVFRLARTILPAAGLLVLAGVFAGTGRTLCWVAALLIDYGGLMLGSTEGWRVEPAHFADRTG